MKKFLALAAVVCMATFAQALQISWTSTEAVYYPADCTVSLVYVVGTDTTAVKEVYESAILATSTKYTTATGAKFHYAEIPALEGHMEMTSSAVEGTYYVFLTDNATDAAWGATFTTDAANTWGEVGGEPPTAGTVTLTFEQVAVPEPTVLALLALGVAGMALRRKVA